VYIGQDLQVAFQSYKVIDDISSSFNGSTTSFALLVNGSAPVPLPINSQQCLISVAGVIQRPDDTGTEGFRLSGGNIVFSSAPATGADFFGVILAGADYINAGGTFPDGSAAAPSITFNSDPDTGIYYSGANQLSISTGGTERSRFTSNGELQSVNLGTASAPAYGFVNDPNTGIYSPGADQLAISTNGVQRINVEADGDINIDSGGVFYDATNNRLAIGTTSPAFGAITGKSLEIEDTSAIPGIRIDGGGSGGALEIYATGENGVIDNRDTGGGLVFRQAGAETARIDSSGRLLVGTSTATAGFASIVPQVQLEGTTVDSTRFSIIRNAANTGSGQIFLGKTRSATNGGFTVVSSGDDLGGISFWGADGTDLTQAASIAAAVDGTPGANDMPGRLVFSTTADGASGPTERMRIDSAGAVLIGATTPNVNNIGIGLDPNGFLYATRAATVVAINRKTTDGTLIDFRQDNALEGSISVSGTTVSYNGAHLSRWSQLPGGDEREEILRGTVLSNIDEICDWGEEDNEQLNRMKVSDVEGDKNVSGVFQSWDDDDDTYTDDFYCAMTGDFIIRIAEGVTVQRGDLLMSAGDGTAKPQDDDIIRSKTIAKVTSTHVTCTYDDGSYCVPCVLMAC
jgi:hypothetical protein